MHWGLREFGHFTALVRDPDAIQVNPKSTEGWLCNDRRTDFKDNIFDYRLSIAETPLLWVLMQIQ